MQWSFLYYKKEMYFVKIYIRNGENVNHMTLRYHQISKELSERIETDRRQGTIPQVGFREEEVVRRVQDKDKASIHRPAFVRDIEKIMHCPYYNRYTDKTQVLSFYRNDDISRRALHVQLVSRIARNIGKVLGLNQDLIEAMALGHDIGHTPFGHAGERILSEIYQGETGRAFNHNVHSVRVLDGIFARNISLQTLDGILCHNGEFAMKEYRPKPLDGFAEFDREMEEAYVNQKSIGRLIPSTLEACVVRICDMIAYLGKDRQDAVCAGIPIPEDAFTRGEIGVENAEMINNLTVNIIENSYGKNYIMLDDEYYQALKVAKEENYHYIYFNEQVDKEYNENIRPMFEMMYERFLHDLKEGNRESIIYRHHIEYVNQYRGYYVKDDPYEAHEKNQIVVDYLASMTDDYFIDLFHYIFPESKYQVHYVPYFTE